MRIQTIMLVVLWTFYSTSISFSQEKRVNLTHPIVKYTKEKHTTSPLVFATLTEMFRSLGIAKTNSQRADIYFWISKYYADHLKIDSALFYGEKIKEESLSAKYEKGMAKYYLSKSSALYYRRQAVDGQELNKAIDIFAKYQDHLFSGIAYRHRGRLYYQLDDFVSSRLNYHISIRFLKMTGNIGEIQRGYYELGKSFYQSYETDSSAFYLITALQLAEKLNDPLRIFYASGFLGELYLITDNLDNAAKYLKYALDIRTAAVSRIEVRNRLGSFAACLMLRGEFEKANEVIKEYEVINGKLGDNWGAIILNKIKGAYYYHKGNYSEGLKYLQLAYSRAGEIESFTFDIKGIAYYLGKTEYEIGYYDSAIRHLSYVIQLANQLKHGADLLDANLFISQSYGKKGDRDSAFYYFRVYDRIKDSLLTFRREKAIIELSTKYETGQKEQQIRLLQREKELNVYQLRAKNDEIEKQTLLDLKKSQQLALLSQQNEISRLESSEKTLAFENQQKEMVKKQNEVALLAKENELQGVLAGKESQRKNFAYIAIATILVFSGYVLYRYAKNKKLSRQLAVSLVELKQAQAQLIRTEKEKEAENIRVRISRDIHDEVGATLSGVALFSEIARQKMKQHNEIDAQVYLDHITANSKEMVEKMSDLVWTINPQNDSFDRIISKLQSFAVNLCAGKGIRLHLDIDDSLRSYYPPMQVRKNIYMLIKEAINNAVKYSEGKNIYLSVHHQEEQMTLEIRDDGKGFDTNLNYGGNGLNNIQARAAELHAKFSIDSQNGRGTCIRLQFNFHPAGGQQEVV